MSILTNKTKEATYKQILNVGSNNSGVTSTTVYITDGAGTQLPIKVGTAATEFYTDLIIPVGTTAQRPSSPSDGSLRINTTDGTTEIYRNTAWRDLEAGGGGGSIETQLDSISQSTATDVYNFSSTYFSLTESPADTFAITLNTEGLQDVVGAMFTGNTETGCTVTYQDADGTIDVVISDLTVAGDSGSTGMTPGDTLTVAGGTGITTSMSGDILTITSTVTSGLSNVVEDTTPQLGGALDVNGKEIQSIGATDIVLHSDNDVNIILGDALGVDDFNIKDSANATVFAVNSDGTVTLAGTVDGRDIATDGTKLDTIESSADVTDETNVVAALSGATLTGVTVATGDKVLIQDVSDTDNIKTVTTQAIANLFSWNVVDDTTPQLGGALDVNGQEIQSVGATNIVLHSDNDVNMILGDALGVDDFNVKDSAGVTVFSVNSDGAVSLSGTVDGRDIAADGATLDAIGNGSTSTAGLLELATDAEVVTGTSTSLVPSVSQLGLVLLGESTASASASVAFTGLNTTYKGYILFFEDLQPATDSVEFHLFFSQDSGSTYLTNYSWASVTSTANGAATASSAASGDAVDSAVRVSATTKNMSNLTTERGGGMIFIENGFTNDRNIYGQIYMSFTADDSNFTTVVGGFGCYSASDTIDALKVQMSSGNISSGNFKLYGIKA